MPVQGAVQVLRDAIRHIVRHPRASISTIIVAALSIGATAAVFSVVNAAALRELPYPEADRLVVARPGGRSWSPVMLDAYERSEPRLESVAGVHERGVTLTGAGPAEVVRLEAVSASYFALLGAAPRAGGLWTAAEDSPTPAGAVAVISDSLSRRLGRPEDVLGRRITVDGTPLSIMGVMPEAFRGLIGRTDIWIPLRFATSLGAEPGAVARPFSRWFEVVGRRPRGTTLAESQAAFDLDARRAMATIPGSAKALGTKWRGTLLPLAVERSDSRLTRASLVLLAATTLVLLLSCANLATLQAIGAVARGRELALRLAIGASRIGLARLLAVETCVLVAAGTAGALAVRVWLLRILAGAVRPPAGTFGIRSSEILTPEATALDVRSALVILSAAVVAALVIALPGLVAALRKGTADLRGGWSAEGAFARRGSSRIAHVLVASEIALALVVLSGASLMAQSARNLWAQDRGFDPNGIVAVEMSVPDARDDAASIRELHSQLAEQLLRIPGVEAVSASSCAPGSGRCRRTNVRQVDGRDLDPHESPTVGVTYVSDNHFAVLRAPIVRGRNFQERDRGGPPAVIVNEALAAGLWPGIDPIGRRLALFFANGSMTQPREVVGVVGDIQFDPVEQAAGPDVYLPASQAVWTSTALFLRSREGRPLTDEAVRRAVREADPDVAVVEAVPLAERIGRGFATERLLSVLLVTFGLAALVLSFAGVYAVISGVVAHGRREIGIRMALGATGADVRGLLLRRLARLTVPGAALGVLGSVFATRSLAAFVFGVAPRDPVTLAGIAAVVLSASLAATFGPTRRALRTDPAMVLRAE